MAYFSNLVNSVTKVISTASNLASSMPFTIDDEPVQQPYNSIWKLKKGKKKVIGNSKNIYSMKF
jgi:glutaminase